MNKEQENTAWGIGGGIAMLFVVLIGLEISGYYNDMGMLLFEVLIGVGVWVVAIYSANRS